MSKTPVVANMMSDIPSVPYNSKTQENSGWALSNSDWYVGMKAVQLVLAPTALTLTLT